MKFNETMLKFWPIALLVVIAAIPLLPTKDYIVVVDAALVLIAASLNIMKYRSNGVGRWAYILSSLCGALAITLLIFDRLGVANPGLTAMQVICQVGAVGYIFMGWFGKKALRA